MVCNEPFTYNSVSVTGCALDKLSPQPPASAAPHFTRHLRPLDTCLFYCRRRVARAVLGVPLPLPFRSFRSFRSVSRFGRRAMAQTMGNCSLQIYRRIACRKFAVKQFSVKLGPSWCEWGNGKWGMGNGKC
jgi:hypothetical protein